MTFDAAPVLAPLGTLAPDLADVYRDLHRHPELGFTEERTAAEVARRVGDRGYDVATGVGGTGVVAVLRNGDGPTVLLRADMDALPVEERSGLPYASTVTTTDDQGHTVPVMHACGHDMHVTCLLGAADLLARSRDRWSGTTMAVFQPAEELGRGAEAMVDDELFDRFGQPDVVLGQHVAPLPAGTVAMRSGPSFAAADGLTITLHGRGGHGSRPEVTVDPVVMAAATVLRLQTVVSREVPAADTAVVTVGSSRSGDKDNVIPDTAELRVNIRTYTPEVRDRVLAAVDRIVKAEAAASGAEHDPEIVVSESFPVVDNDPDAIARVRSVLSRVLGDGQVAEVPVGTGSEDVGVFGTAAGVPTAYWLFGGADPQAFAAAARAGTVERDIPSNHQPTFAPVIEPTLTTGVTALTATALDRLATS